MVALKFLLAAVFSIAPMTSLSGVNHPCSPAMLQLAKQDYETYSAPSEQQFVAVNGDQAPAVKASLKDLHQKMTRVVSASHRDASVKEDDFRLSHLVEVTRVAQLQILFALHSDEPVSDADKVRYITCGALTEASLSTGSFAGWRTDNGVCLDLPADAPSAQVTAAVMGYLQQRIEAERTKQKLIAQLRTKQ